jgi:ketosteroid isomerase-like protein
MKIFSRIILYALYAFVVSGIGVSAANDPAEEKALMATLEAMAKATIAKDVAMLTRIYGEELTYVHGSSGMIETKAQVLKRIPGPGEVEFMRFSDTTFRIYGNVALVMGVTDFREGRPGNQIDNHLNILWVMVKRSEGPYGWQIVARHTTHIKPSPIPVPAK